MRCRLIFQLIIAAVRNKRSNNSKGDCKQIFLQSFSTVMGVRCVLCAESINLNVQMER
jgi:hypothetical protein